MHSHTLEDEFGVLYKYGDTGCLGAMYALASAGLLHAAEDANTRTLMQWATV